MAASRASHLDKLALSVAGASPSQGDGVAEGASTSPQLEAEEIEQLARKMLPLFVQYATVNFPSEVGCQEDVGGSRTPVHRSVVVEP